MQRSVVGALGVALVAAGGIGCDVEDTEATEATGEETAQEEVVETNEEALGGLFCGDFTFEPHRYEQLSWVAVPLHVCWGTAGVAQLVAYENGYGGTNVKVKLRLWASTGSAPLKTGTVGWGSGGSWDVISRTKAGSFDYGEVEVCHGFSCDKLQLWGDGGSGGPPAW